MAISYVNGIFDHLNMDGIDAEMSGQQYRFASTTTKIRELARKGYITSSFANKLLAGLPEGSDLRGWYHMEEKDWHIFFNRVNGQDTIGVFREEDSTYYRVIVDSDLDFPLNFEACKWFRIVANVHGNCNRIKLVYSDKDRVYRSVEITDPCCDAAGVEPLDTLVFKPKCIGTVAVLPIEGLGNLRAGSYSASLRMYDIEGNKVNYSILSDPIKISGGDNIQGEEVNYALSISADNLPDDYSLGELVIVESVGGLDRTKVISNIGIGNNQMRLTYTGREGAYEPEKIRDVRDRLRHVFKGDGVATHMGRPILYNLEPERNFNYQQYANEIIWRYEAFAVPADEAKYYKRFRAGEFYMLGISLNWLDGRRTNTFIGINDNYQEGYNAAIETCNGCTVPTWFATDTSERTALHLTSSEFQSTGGSETLNGKFKLTQNPNARIITKEQGIDDETGADKGTFRTILNAGWKVIKFILSIFLFGLKLLKLLFKAIKALFGVLKSIGSALVSVGQTIVNFVAGTDYGNEEEPVDDTGDGPQESDGPSGTESETAEDGLDGAAVSQQQKYYSDEQLASEDQKDEYFGSDAGNVVAPPASSSIHKLESGFACTPGDIDMVDDLCYVCNSSGQWEYANNAHYFDKISPKKKSPRRDPITGPAAAITTPRDPNNENCNELTKPIHYSSGKFGYGESEELYPTQIGRDDCLPIFREYAGQNQRSFRAPTLTKEKSFISFKKGVNGSVLDQSWVIIMGLSASNIVIPDYIREQLCPITPYNIDIVPRSEADKMVLSSGILHNTFAGDVEGETELFPKHVVNAFEHYDPSITTGSNTLRKGTGSSVDAHLYHSPDVLLYGNRSDAQFAFLDLELSGEGERYGQYAEGTENKSLKISRINQSGTRNGVNLNQADAIGAQPIFKCVKAMEHAKADIVVPANGKFTHPLNNKWRESGTYVEFDGVKTPFSQDAIGAYGSIGGSDQTSDNSLIGDGIDHASMIGNARAHHCTMMRFLPRQYGSVINMNFIPTGLQGSGDTVIGIAGDSYVGSYAYKRTSVVSDKTYEQTTPEANFGGVPWWATVLGILLIGPVVLILKSMIRDLAKAIGFQKCGSIPVSGDTEDIRNKYSLRPGMRAISNTDPGAMIVGAPATGDYEDVYAPITCSSWIHSFFTSDVVLEYRGTGIIQLQDDIERKDNIAQVHPLNTKTLDLDASSPAGSDWRYAYMNRFGKINIEYSGIKMLIRYALNILWTFGPGLYIGFLGSKMVIEALSNSIIGFNFSWLTVIAVAIGIVITLLGWLWVRYWIGTDLDNKLIDSILNIKGCYPDIENDNLDGTLQGSKWSLKLGKHLYGLEDNYYYYNPDLLKQNVAETNFGMPKNYDTEWCPTEYQTQVIAGGKQNPASHIDNWKNFNPYNTLDIPRDRGAISVIHSIGGRLLVHLTDALYIVGVRDKVIDLVSDARPLSNQGIFGGAQELYGGTIEGFGGTKDPNAGYVTSDAYYYIDYDAKRPYAYTGRPSEQPLPGVEVFFDEFMHFSILDSWPDFGPRDQKCADGIHFDIGINHNKDLVYFYKKDYKLKKTSKQNSTGTWTNGTNTFNDAREMSLYEDNSCVLVYDIKSRRFIGIEYWTPDIFFFNRHTMFATKGDEIYSFDEKYKFRNFFGEDYPQVVQTVVPIPAPNSNISSIKTIKLIGEVVQYASDGMKTKLIYEPIVEKIMFYNGTQSTGWLDVIEEARNDTDSMVEKYDEEKDSETDWRRLSNGMMFSKVINIVPKNKASFNKFNDDLKIWETDYVQDVELYDGNDDNFQLEDDYIGVALYIKKDSSKQVVIRKVNIEVDSKNGSAIVT